MAYQIVDGNIVSKDTQGAVRKFSKENVDVIISESKRQGITNKYLIAGILATISKESGFKPQNENLNYSSDGLRKTFPSYFGNGKEDPNQYAKKPEKIANYVYGNRYGNSEPGDGWKFRGRGFNQITFKSGYNEYKNIIPNILENPDLLNNVTDAAKAAISFYVKSFKSPVVKKNYGKSASDMSDWDEALLLVINATAGLGKSKSNPSVKYNYDKAKLCHSFLIEYLEKLPTDENKNNPPLNSTEDVNNNIDNNENLDSSDNTNDDSNSNQSLSVNQLTQFFPPNISPQEINIDVAEFKRKDRKKFEKGLGFVPFIWYNGIQIDSKDVLNFKLYHSDILPTISLLFRDSYSLFREDGFPQDDTLITIYINSRSLNLRSIYMDFKIYDFKDLGDGTYTLTGICNIPEIFIRRFSSYKGKTSHEALQDLCKQLQIGFCSNVSNSNDKMTWINTGNKNIDFIKNIIKNSYISDSSFQHCYIDYYYNLCYIDISKEVNRDISNDKMVTGFGYSLLNNDVPSEKNDESITPLILTNDQSLRESISYFDKWDIVNKSTKVSINNAYRNISKFYDTTKKEILAFTVESQTSDGSKTLILKGRPNDNSFFNDNTTSTWVGKQDIYDDGSGNVHLNYNYSIIQNSQNLNDITKIFCKITLPNPNFNLYIFQKVFIAFVDSKPSPVNDQKFLKRFTGDWLITNIEYTCEGKIIQEITLIKRELELNASESK